MKTTEFEKLTNDKLIIVEDLKPYITDRTLLYGYTCNRDTFHVYLKNQEIHTVIYNTDYSGKVAKPINMRKVFVKNNQDFIPDKRIYPEASDYTFCKLLKEKNCHLPFTFFNKERKESKFYGFTLED